MGRRYGSNAPARGGKAAFELGSGMYGLMVTCNKDQEARCTSEIMQLLEKVTELQDVRSDDESPSGEGEALGTVEGHNSFADSIAREVAVLKARDNKQFQTVALGGISCILFIRTKTDPLELALKIFSRTHKGRALHAARFCQRIIPLSIICGANLDDLRREAIPLIASAFREGPFSVSMRDGCLFMFR